jgi:DinB superfamily
MTARATRLLDRIDHERCTVLDLVGGLGAEQLVFRPEPSSWSALEVVEHLMKVEDAIATRVKPRPPRTWREAVRGRVSLELLSLFFLLRRRFKAPGQVILPHGGVTLSDLVTKWEAAGQALRRTIDGFGPVDYRRPMMRHPFIGLLTPIETLTFIHRHIAHHRRQILRLRRAPGYPLDVER